MLKLSITTAVLLIAGQVVAQGPTATHPNTVPEMYTGSYAGSANLLPMGRSKTLIQYYINNAHVRTASPLVRSIGWRRVRGSTQTAALPLKLEILIGYTGSTFSTLSKTFTANFQGTPTTFLKMKTLNFPGLPSNDPDKPALWINGDRPFINNQSTKDWIIQVENATEATPRTIQGWFADAIPTSRSGVVTRTDSSCGGSMQTSYPTAGQVTLGVTGAQPASPVIYLMGLNLFSPADLGSIIGTGCSIVVNPLVVVDARADASGAHSFSFPLATPTNSSLAVHFQAIHLKNSSLASTDATHLWLGRNGALNYVYNWTTFTPTAQYGPYTTNRGPVHLLR